MQVETTLKYEKYRKKLTKNNPHLFNLLDETLELFKKDKNSSTLHLKKISCSKERDLYSIRVKSTQYRVLMNYYPDLHKSYLSCICTHDDYDRIIRNC